MTQNLEMSVFAITQWVYFTYNYPSPKELFENVYGKGNLADHIYHKWLDYKCNWGELFCALDREKQQKLAAWVIENYHGIDSRRPK